MGSAGFGSWGERFNPQRRQSLPTPLADILSCQWCGKPPLSMSNGGCNSVHRLYSLAGPQMASQTVGRTQASDIFRYSDIQIFRYSEKEKESGVVGSCSQKEKEKKKKRGGGGFFPKKKKKKKKKK